MFKKLISGLTGSNFIADLFCAGYWHCQWTPVSFTRNRAIRWQRWWLLYFSPQRSPIAGQIYLTTLVLSVMLAALLRQPMGLILKRSESNNTHRNLGSGGLIWKSRIITYDGEEEIAEFHPSTKSADIYAAMRNLTDMTWKRSRVMFSSSLRSSAKSGRRKNLLSKLVVKPWGWAGRRVKSNKNTLQFF